MKTIRASIALGLMLAALVSTPARAALTAVRAVSPTPPFSLGAVVTDMTVTPDDRYLLVVSAADNKLRFFDTWDFTLLTGTNHEVTLADIPTSVTTSPDGKYAYVGLQNGKVDIIPLAALLHLEPHEGLAAAITTQNITMASLPIRGLMVLPEGGGAGNPVFLFVRLVSGLRWGRIDNGTILRDNYIADYGTGQNTLRLAGGQYLGYYTYTAFGASYLQALKCTNALGCFSASTSPLLLGADTVSGLAGDRKYDRFALTQNTPLSDLHLIDTKPVETMYVRDSFTVDHETKDIAFVTSPPALAATAAGSTITVSEFIDGDTLTFTGTRKQLVLTGANFSEIAAGKGDDGNLYVSAAGGAMYLVTANPWIQGLTIAGGSTVSGETMSVSFKLMSHQTGLYGISIYNSRTFGTWGPALGTMTTTLSGESINVSFNVDTSALDEGTVNVLTVIAKDPLNRKGRMARTAWVDTPPGAPTFDLGFGNGLINVDIKGLPDRDLKEYRIYYGTNGGDTVSYTAMNGASSPLTIAAPAADKDYTRTIKGLVNGVRVYVQVAAEDKAGHFAVSERLSAVPQQVADLGAMTGEEGGVDCLGSVSGRGGDPRSAVGLVLPVAVLFVLGAVARRKK